MTDQAAGCRAAQSSSGKLRVLSLFAGIGGFDLGLERTGGFETVAFCEIEPFAVRVLNKHWPEVPVYGDVRELSAARLAADGIAVDCIVGGFPCQDISAAGAGAGIEGERSGLWTEFARLIGEVRPAFVIVENVAALLGRGLERVLGDLAALGYDADWHCIPACAVGAPHRRDRLWIVAYDPSDGRRARRARRSYPSRARQSERPLSHVADAKVVTVGTGLCQDEQTGERWGRFGYRSGANGQWTVEPDVGRVAHGIPSRVDRLRCLGNAVVPQIPELIGRAILASLQTQAEAA